MANKSDKFDIKFWKAVDLGSKYILNPIPYLGKDETRPATQRLSESVVIKLVEPYLSKGRNITTDNFFTSIHLATQLRKKKTSRVGALNKIRKEVPPLVKTLQQSRYFSKLLQTKNENNQATMLTVYQRKQKKNVCILSTFYSSVMVDRTTKKKPETVTFYNKTKCDVDIADQMARQYTVKAGTRRWPVAVFYKILDLAYINAYVLYKKKTGDTISRRNFMFQLATELREAHGQGKTAPPAAVLPPLFNDFYQNSMVDGSRKRKQCQVSVKCEQNKSAKFCCRSVCGKCTGCVKIECVLCAERC